MLFRSSLRDVEHLLRNDSTKIAFEDTILLLGTREFLAGKGLLHTHNNPQLYVQLGVIIETLKTEMQAYGKENATMEVTIFDKLINEMVQLQANFGGPIPEKDREKYKREISGKVKKIETREKNHGQ